MKKYRHFPREYKQRIVNEIESGLRSRSEIIRDEEIAISLVDRWRKQIKEGTLVDSINPAEGSFKTDFLK